MRGGTQYNNSFVIQLVHADEGWNTTIIICYATCADEGWNTVQYSLLCSLCMQMRGGTQYNILCYAACADEVWNTVQ